MNNKKQEELKKDYNDYVDYINRKYPRYPDPVFLYQFEDVVKWLKKRKKRK